MLIHEILVIRILIISRRWTRTWRRWLTEGTKLKVEGFKIYFVICHVLLQILAIKTSKKTRSGAYMSGWKQLFNQDRKATKPVFADG